MHSVNIFEIFWQVLFDERAGMLHRFPHWFWWHLCVVPHLAWRESILADSTNREEHWHIHQLGALRKTGRHFPGRPCGRLPENWTPARIYFYYSLRCVCVCVCTFQDSLVYPLISVNVINKKSTCLKYLKKQIVL